MQTRVNEKKKKNCFNKNINHRALNFFMICLNMLMLEEKEDTFMSQTCFATNK